MSSIPISLANNLNEEKSAFLSTSPPSSVSGLYIPVHRRQTSMSRTDDSFSSFSSSSSVSSVSSRPSSRAESHVESESGLGHQQIGAPHVYSREALLALSKSPLSHMLKEVKDGLRDHVPEIVMSRKTRKAMEYRIRMQQQINQKETNVSSDEPPRPRHPSQPRKSQSQLQDSPANPPQQQLPEQSRRQVRLDRRQEQHAAALPRANQEKKWLAGSSMHAGSPGADLSWRRTAGPPSITISAA